jgi:membrane-associated protease RseP (regulator of RpoE activity)
VDETLDRAVPPPGGPPGPADGRPAPFIIPSVPPRDRVWLHVLLLALTVVSTTLVGAGMHRAWAAGFGGAGLLQPQQFFEPSFYLNGLWYSATVLAILGCHEMGHYLACRYYRVDASLPFFLPVPFFLTGTLGAFIRIRQRIPSKIALFDIGIAGPIAGFLVAVPALFVGLQLSVVERVPEQFVGYELGEPLLFRFFAWMIWGDVPDGMSINMHPMAFASWFGLLATALNLFPIGQLDGGHVAYAVLGRRSSLITLVMIVVAITLTFVSLSWLAWTILMVIMLLVVGPHHPPTLNDDVQLDGARLAIAVSGLVMWIVCFTPAPIEFLIKGQ